MITKYVVRNNINDEAIEVDSMSEAQEVIMLLKEQNPNTEYSVDEKQISSVKPGFGRDPDLH
jgi:hypothetical protein